jgi:hypothetical protein
MLSGPGLLRWLRPLLPRRWRLPLAFDAVAYRAANADLAGGGAGGAAWHFLRHGRGEGRWPCMLAAARHEAALWAGEEAAAAALARLADRGDSALAERLWARLALARVAATVGDWAAAAARLERQEAALAQIIGLPDPLFLCAEVALNRGDPATADLALRLAAGCGAPAFGIGLLGAALARARGAQAGTGAAAADAAWSAALAPLYARAGLATPELRPAMPGAETATGAGGQPAFDRLTARAAPPMLEGPLVSVLVPARNAGATLDTALASLAAQSWRTLEILVIDNGSQDDTAARALDWAARDPRIRLIAGEAALGAYGARNRGLAAARGAFLALQDADDWSHPQRIACQMQALAAAPDRPACLSHWARTSPDLVPGCSRPDLRVVHPNLSSLVIRRAAIDRIGVWDRVRAAADSEYIARLRQVFGAEALAMVRPGVPLAFGRQRAGSLSRAEGTGLLGAGAAARTAYLAAAAAWHRAAGLPHLADGAEPRPFPVPSTLRLDGPAEGWP